MVPQRINFKREEGNVVHSHSQFINIKKSLIESVSLEPILTRSDNMGVVKTEPAVKESLKTERPQNQAHIYSEIRASIRSTNLPTQQKLITIDNFEIYEKRGKGAFGDIFMAR